MASRAYRLIVLKWFHGDPRWRRPGQKIQLFGYSFVSRLWVTVDNPDHLIFIWTFTDFPLYNTPATQELRFVLHVASWKTSIIYFSPDMLLLVIGTNDIYNNSETPESVAWHVCDLVDTLFFVIGIPQVIISQTLHRSNSSARTIYAVNSDWFNTRGDELNMLLMDELNHSMHGSSYLWKLKWFRSNECKERNFAADGSHLFNAGQLRFISNIRAAVAPR